MTVNNTTKSSYEKEMTTAVTTHSVTTLNYTNYNTNESNRDTIIESLSYISNNNNFNEKISQVASSLNEEDLKLFAFVLNESDKMDKFSSVILSDKNIKTVNEDGTIQVKQRLIFNTNEEALDFIDETLSHLKTSVKNGHFEKKNYAENKSQQFVDTFEDIKSNYIKTIDENNAALGIMTKYTKPLSLEQKEQEQIDLAMKGHRLDPKSGLDQYTFKFMKEGYSQKDAEERAMAYKDAGIIPNTEFFEKFGVTLYNLSFIAHNPEYKNALEKSFEKMDTD